MQIIRDLNIEPRNLQHNETPLNLGNFMHSPVDLHTSVVQNMGYGVVGMPSDPDSGSFSLLSGLNHVFSQSQFVLATFGEYTVALLPSVDAGNYLIFDSHACNDNGITDSAGTAVLLEFSSLNDLEEHLSEIYYWGLFQFSPVVIETAHFSEQDITRDLQDSDISMTRERDTVFENKCPNSVTCVQKGTCRQKKARKQVGESNTYKDSSNNAFDGKPDHTLLCAS